MWGVTYNADDYTDYDRRRDLTRIRCAGRASMLFGFLASGLGIASVLVALSFLSCLGTPYNGVFWASLAANCLHFVTSFVRVAAYLEESDQREIAAKLNVLSALGEFGALLSITTWGVLLWVASFVSYLSLVALGLICANMCFIVYIQWIITQRKLMRTPNAPRIGMTGMLISLAALVVFGFSVTVAVDRPPPIRYDFSAPFPVHASNTGTGQHCATYYANATIQCHGVVWAPPAYLSCELCVLGDNDCYSTADVQAFVEYYASGPVVTFPAYVFLGDYNEYVSAFGGSDSCYLPSTLVPRAFNGSLHYCNDPTLPVQDNTGPFPVVTRVCPVSQFGLGCSAALTTSAPSASVVTLSPSPPTLSPPSPSFSWDVAANFTVNNPNGPWVYGVLSGLSESSFTAMAGPAEASSCPITFYDSDDHAKVWKNTCSGLIVNTDPVEPGQVGIDPGNTAEYISIRWLCPFLDGGVFNISVTFSGGHTGDTQAWVVLNNLQQLFHTTSTINGPNSFNASMISIAYSVPIDFIVAGFGSDSSDTPVAITLVPS